jgi:hypothetical protein
MKRKERSTRKGKDLERDIKEKGQEGSDRRKEKNEIGRDGWWRIRRDRTGRDRRVKAHEWKEKDRKDMK